jgi:hypothetical protein
MRNLLFNVSIAVTMVTMFVVMLWASLRFVLGNNIAGSPLRVTLKTRRTNGDIKSTTRSGRRSKTARPLSRLCNAWRSE